VLSTIVDNIKSFFVKEQELSQPPKPMPQAASDIFEKPKIVERPLPQLPFSPQQLREALDAKPVAQEATVRVETPAPKPVPKEETRRVQEEITHEIAEFEHALRTVQHVPRKTVEEPTRVLEHQGPLFFAEFEQFMTRENLESEGLLEKDILWRMKEFHRHRQEGKEYYIFSQDAKSAIQRRLTELKDLEKEWFARRSDADAIERELHYIEQDIDTRAQELKRLLTQASTQAKLEHKAPEGHEFVLADGTKVASLQDLHRIAHRMPEWLFLHHVTPTRNDFAIWVRHVLNDQDRAARIESARTRSDLVNALADA
jgi:hypothetical protein